MVLLVWFEYVQLRTVEQSISKTPSAAKVRRQNVLCTNGHSNNVYEKLVGFVCCPKENKLLMT